MPTCRVNDEELQSLLAVERLLGEKAAERSDPVAVLRRRVESPAPMTRLLLRDAKAVLASPPDENLRCDTDGDDDAALPREPLLFIGGGTSELSACIDATEVAAGGGGA